MTSPLTIRTILAAALLIAWPATATLAQAPPSGAGSPLGAMHGPMGRMDGELWLMIRGAALTPEQQAKVRGILSTHRATTRPLVEQLRQAQQELGAKLLAPGPLQPADLQPQLGRIGQLRDQLAQDGAQAALEVRAVLTPEQLARAAQTKERLTQLREEMHQLVQPPRP
jgi:Spy/CpxP family protein refolding chaperone